METDGEFAKEFLDLLLTKDVATEYNLEQVICTIEESVFNSEHIGFDNENTRRFGHLILNDEELESAVPEHAEGDSDNEEDFGM